MISYDVQFDLDRDGTFGNPVGYIGDRLLTANWSLGISSSFLHMAQPLAVTLTINDPDLSFSQDVGTSPFGVPLRNMMVRIRATVGGQTTRTLVTGWVTDAQSSDTAFGSVTRVVIEDRMLQLQDAEYLPVYATNVRVDEEIQNVFDTAIIAYPYLSSYWILDASQLDVNTTLFEQTITDLEQALTTLAYAGDSTDEGRGVSALGYISQILQAEKGGRFFTNREGKFTFHNRYHDVQLVANETFTDDEYIGFNLVQGEVFNDITINYVPRSAGTPGTILYTAQNLPIEIFPMTTRRIAGRYYNTDAPNATVGGKDVITPIPTTDYTAIGTTTGEDVTASLNWQFEIGGTSTNILINNPTNASATITKLQVRGTPVFTYALEQSRSTNPTSIYKYGRIPFPIITAPFINTEVIAQGWADQLGARYAEPAQRYESIDFIIGSLDSSLDDLAERVLSRSVGEAIRIVNSVTGHNKTYAIVGESHNMTGVAHQVRWVLRPTDRTKVWVLGRDSLDIDTLLAF